MPPRSAVRTAGVAACARSNRMSSHSVGPIFGTSVAYPKKNPPEGLGRLNLEQEGVALAAAGADRGEPEAAAVPAQLVHHRPDDARARGPDRVPERDCAAVHVHALLVGAEHLRRVEHDRRERLVQLDALDVVDLLAGLLERERAGLGGGAGEAG